MNVSIDTLPDGKTVRDGFGSTSADVRALGPAFADDAAFALGRDAERQAVGSYDGARLMLARSGGADADDRFGAAGTLSPLNEGGALVVGGIAVGTVTRNSGGTLLLTFSGADAGEDNVDAVLRQVTYANRARDPAASVEIHWVFSDGGALIAEGRTVVAVPLAGHAPMWRSAHRAR